MSVIAEFTVPTESFLLEETLSAVPQMVVEIQQVVAHSEERLMPLFWVSDGDFEGFDDAIRDDSTVSNVTKLDEMERGTSYRAEWTENIQAVAHAYLETGAILLEATGQDDRWELRMRFDDDAAVTEFNDYCEDVGVPFELNRLYRPDQPKAGGQYGLTPTQRETLVIALDRGFYEIPQGATMEDLADEVGVSQQSLSKRLRRGHRNLVRNTLVINPPDETTEKEKGGQRT